jgi:hypothetical protein
MFDLFSVNPMIREPNQVVKNKKVKKRLFWPIFEVEALGVPINRGLEGCRPAFAGTFW